MDDTVKQRWITALRSDTYHPGYHLLNYVDTDHVQRHCATGVLCELAVNDGALHREQEWHWDSLRRVWSSGYGHHRDTHLIPLAVDDWAHLSSHDLYVLLFLAADNDTGTSFADLADTINDQL